jgi:putative DNA primase/helicase
MTDKWTGNDIIFKTYVLGNPSGDGKHPKEKVKGRDYIHDWDEVEQEDCFGAILNDGFVDVSFDSQDMFNAFLNMAEQNNWKCLALPSTHGGHTYWKKPRTHRIKNGVDKKLAVGLKADIHSGSTYIPLCVHGKKRFPPEYDILEDENYQEVPEELWPVTTSIELWGMQTGDGRNDDLFKYILILQRLQIGTDVIRRILTNANSYVFDSPLDESELEVIMRDEAFQVPNFFNENNAFLFDKFAQYLVNTQHIVKIRGQLHVFTDGVYESGKEALERVMIRIIPSLKASQRLEVTKYLQLVAPDKKPADPQYIAFRNGVYDLESETIIPYTPDLFITNKIDLIYDPNFYNELGDNSLNALTCGDPSIRALLEECVGYCFYRENNMRKAFILTGGKRNGKSTFLDWLKNTLGENNICALDLKELSDRFNTAMMFGKLANIGDDIGDDFLQGTQVAMFKKITAGNRIKAEQKGLDPFEFNPYVKLFFSANDVPRMKDKTGAVLDRLLIIPFENEFGSDTANTNLGKELSAEEPRMYLVRVGIDGLKRLYKQNKGTFTHSDKVENQSKEYERENSPIIGFIEDSDIDTDIVNEPTRDVYRRYTVFCAENNMNPMSNIQFSKVIKRELKLSIKAVRVHGRKCNVFVR